MTRRLIVVAFIAILGFVPVRTLGAQEPTDEGTGNNDNAAVAVNTRDGSDVFRLAFSIDRVMRSDADEADNAAVAAASCEACETTAIAIQVVLLMTPPDGDFSPTNLAIAINENCLSCETTALAYQIVLQTDGPVRLTAAGQTKIAEILRKIRDLDDADLSPAELEAQTDALVDELIGVLEEELVPIGSDQDEANDTDVGTETEPPGDTTGAGDPSPAPDVTSAPDPTAAATAQPTEAPATDAPTTTDAPAASP